MTAVPTTTPAPTQPPAARPRDEGDRARYARFVQLVQLEIGVTLSEPKRAMVETRLRRRFTALGLSDLGGYLRYLEDPEALAGERAAIYDAVTTNKTDFFREPTHFDHLAEVSLPEAVARAADRRGPVKIWSAAASTGAEAWTAAIVVSEFARLRGPFEWGIIGTDVNSQVLETARAAVYRDDFLAPVPPELRKTYFNRGSGAHAGHSRVVPALRKRVRFHRLNLMADSLPVERHIDVIFLRNVLIYFSPGDQARVIDAMARHLAPGGVLYLGHSEGMMMQNAALAQVATAAFRKKG